MCAAKGLTALRPSFFKSFGDVCLDPRSMYLKQEVFFFFLEALKQ